MTMLWLDDLRPAPDGWVWAKSANEARRVVLADGPVTFMSLDHDLGDFAADGGDAITFTDWLAEFNHWPTQGIRIHSSNPVGIQSMLATVDRYSDFPLGYGNARGANPPGGWPPALVP